MLDKTAAVSYAKKYAEEVRKEYNPHAIVLFGSYVNGNPREDSDIDIAVVYNGFNGDWLATSSKLWRMCENINLYIEPILLDTERDKSGFADYVMRTGYMIYKA